MPITSPFRSTQRVYFDDLDALNILHNVRFLIRTAEAMRAAIRAGAFDRWAAEWRRRYLQPESP